MKRIILVVSLIVFANQLSITQVLYEPLDKEVYPFLQRLNHRGVIEFDDLFRPLSKKYIVSKLTEVKSKLELLTNLEKDELEFFLKDYLLEIESMEETPSVKKNMTYFGYDKFDRYRFFSYTDNLFKFAANPILGFDLSFKDNIRSTHSWMGFTLQSYLKNNLGFHLTFKTHNERGSKLDIKKDFTPETGIIPSISDLGRDISYTEVLSSLSFDWDWGSAFIGKDYLEYGYAKYGNLVLSDKAPSFPFIRFEIKPVDWFKFSYFHAWLSSLIIDSVSLANYNRNIYKDKYFAWHSLTLTPFRGLDFSIGESVVYANKLEPLYLMPIMFYYAADEFISNREGKPGDANQQIFLTLSSKDHIWNTHLYATLFVDEMTIGGINGSLFINTTYGGDVKSRERTQLGYTLGFSVTDLPMDNLTIGVEYTRINPFVYGHHDTAQTYRNSGYLMGHWMGHNADLIHFDVNYRFLRGLQANLWGTFIRKGSSDYFMQYRRPQPDFLFGLRKNYSYYGFNIKYEWLHDLHFEARFKNTVSSIEQSDGSFKDKKINEFGITMFYGF